MLARGCFAQTGKRRSWARERTLYTRESCIFSRNPVCFCHSDSKVMRGTPHSSTSNQQPDKSSHCCRSVCVAAESKSPCTVWRNPTFSVYLQNTKLIWSNKCTLIEFFWGNFCLLKADQMRKASKSWEGIRVSWQIFAKQRQWWLFLPGKTFLWKFMWKKKPLQSCLSKLRRCHPNPNFERRCHNFSREKLFFLTISAKIHDVFPFQVIWGGCGVEGHSKSNRNVVTEIKAPESSIQEKYEYTGFTVKMRIFQAFWLILSLG